MGENRNKLIQWNKDFKVSAGRPTSAYHHRADGQQTQYAESTLIQRWFTVCDAGPTFIQHWFNVCWVGMDSPHTRLSTHRVTWHRTSRISQLGMILRPAWIPHTYNVICHCNRRQRQTAVTAYLNEVSSYSCLPLHRSYVTAGDDSGGLHGAITHVKCHVTARLT